MPVHFTCGRCGEHVTAPSELKEDDLHNHLLGHLRECHPSNKHLARGETIARSCIGDDTVRDRRN